MFIKVGNRTINTKRIESIRDDVVNLTVIFRHSYRQEPITAGETFSGTEATLLRTYFDSVSMDLQAVALEEARKLGKDARP